MILKIGTIGEKEIYTRRMIKRRESTKHLPSSSSVIQHSRSRNPNLADEYKLSGGGEGYRYNS